MYLLETVVNTKYHVKGKYTVYL